MPTKSSAHYQREYRKRLREQGLVKKEVWILPENAGKLSGVEKALRQSGVNIVVGEQGVIMGQSDTEREAVLDSRWNTELLLGALVKEGLFTAKRASVELVQGVEPALLIVMYEYGDLPLFMTVEGDQIIVEAVLWPQSAVVDEAQFHDAVLRTHKYFPLSTISLDSVAGADDCYMMFGALSANSSIDDVLLEIDVLSSNVIQATQAYGEYLSL